MNGKKESPHITALRKQDKLNRKASKRIRVVNGKVEEYVAKPPTQDIETVVASILQPGQIVEGRGIFLGKWSLADKQGCGLSRVFNVYAAPEDVPDVRGYPETVELVAGLKKWHGHDGADYANDEALYEALRKGEYKGGWVIPPLPLLVGVTGDKPAGYREPAFVTQPDNLFDHRNKGNFKDSFKNLYYFSSTEHHEAHKRATSVWSAGMIYGNTYWNGKRINCFACRPVRLEPVA